MLKKIVTVFIVFSSLYLEAQNWPVIYGETRKAYECFSLTDDYDYGFLIAGNMGTNQDSPQRALLIKTDINGNLLWRKKFGNDNYHSGFLVVKKTHDNGTVLSGSTTKYDTEDLPDPLFIKLNPCGNTEWCTVIHDEPGGSSPNVGTGIIELSDGSFIGMIAYYGSDPNLYRISLIKLDNYGNPVWVEHLSQNDSTFNEEGHDLILTTDSNYMVGGFCAPGMRPYFILTDKRGNTIWSLKWQDSQFRGIADQIIEKDSGLFYASGTGQKVNEHMKPMLLKFNKYGKQLYRKVLFDLDTTLGAGGGPMAVINDTTLVFGYNWRTDPNHVEGFSGIAITDTLGNFLTRRLLFNQLLQPESIITSFDNKIVVLCNYYTNTFNTYLWKMNTDLQDDTLYTQPYHYDTLCSNNIISEDSIDLNCGLYVNIKDIPTRKEYKNPLKIFPNPSDNTINIEINLQKREHYVLKIFDANGRIYKRFTLPSSFNNKLSINVLSWPKGLYMVALYSDYKFIASKRIMIE